MGFGRVEMLKNGRWFSISSGHFKFPVANTISCEGSDEEPEPYSVLLPPFRL